MERKRETKFWPMMITVFLGSFVVMLSSSTINIALPYLMTNMNTDLDTAKWAMTGFMLTMGATAPLAAFLGEKISYKRLYLLSVAGFSVVSLFVVFSSNIYMLIAIRVLQGLFGGVTVPVTMAVIYQVVPKEKQIMAISIWSIAPTLAPAVGPTISGFLIRYLSWKAIFLINIPLGLAAVMMGLVYIPYYRISADKSLDKFGVFFSVATSMCLLFAFSEGATYGWGAPVIILLLSAGVVFLAAFIAWELRSKNPVLNLRVFGYRKFLFSVIIGCVINIALYSGTFLTPIFLQQIQGMEPLDAALVLLPATICMAVLMPFVGKVYKRTGALPLLIIGVLLISFGTWRMTQLTADTDHGYVTLWMAVRYIGLAIATMPASNSGMITLPKELTGYGSSILNWTKQLVACLSIGVFSSVLTSRATSHITALAVQAASKAAVKAAQLSGYVMAVDDIYTISCVVILVALPFSLFLRKNRKKVSQEANA